MDEHNVEPELMGWMTYNMPSPRIAATESFSLRSSRTCHNNGMGSSAVLDRVSTSKPTQRAVLVSDESLILLRVKITYTQSVSILTAVSA